MVMSTNLGSLYVDHHSGNLGNLNRCGQQNQIGIGNAQSAVEQHTPDKRISQQKNDNIEHTTV